MGVSWAVTKRDGTKWSARAAAATPWPGPSKAAMRPNKEQIALRQISITLSVPTLETRDQKMARLVSAGILVFFNNSFGYYEGMSTSWDVTRVRHTRGAMDGMVGR